MILTKEQIEEIEGRASFIKQLTITGPDLLLMGITPEIFSALIESHEELRLELSLVKSLGAIEKQTSDRALTLSASLENQLAKARAEIEGLKEVIEEYTDMAADCDRI